MSKLIFLSVRSKVLLSPMKIYEKTFVVDNRDILVCSLNWASLDCQFITMTK